MKRFISICRALTYASGVIPECFSRESAVAKRRYSVTLRTAKSHGMTSALGGRTAPGFTLIELLVVVLIIGILAGVAVPQYTKAVLKARYTELQTTIFAFKNASEVYYMANGDYPQSWEDTDLDLPTGCSLNTGADRGWMYCKKNQLSFDFFDANNQNLVGFYSVNGIFKVGYIQWLDNSPYPAQRECWARTQDEEGTSFCKSLGGVVGPTVSHASCTTNGGCTRYILP